MNRKKKVFERSFFILGELQIEWFVDEKAKFFKLKVNARYTCKSIVRRFQPHWTNLSGYLENWSDVICLKFYSKEFSCYSRNDIIRDFVKHLWLDVFDCVYFSIKCIINVLYFIKDIKIMEENFSLFLKRIKNIFLVF